MKIKYYSNICLFILLLFLFSCKTNTGKSGKKIISASIIPQKYFLEQIAGDKFEYNILVPPGASPEVYEPTPKQIQDVSRSIIYFKIGYFELEEQLMKNEFENVEIFDASKHLSLIKSNHHHGDENVHGIIEGIDPHTWSSPKQVKIICKDLLDILIKKQPEDSLFFKNNYKALMNKVDYIDSLVQITASMSANKSFIIFHPALTYLARDYNLNQVSIEMEGKNPSPAHFKEVIELAKENKIKHLLVQKQFDTKNAETIAKEIGGDIIIIDPLQENWYDAMIDINNALRKALSKE